MLNSCAWRFGLLLGAALLFAAPSFGQALDRDQQKCVNGLNKGGARINRAQNRESARCWKLFQKGKEPSAEGCWLADSRGKVLKASEKLFGQEPGLCGNIAPPPYGYTSAFVVTAAAREQSLFFLQDLMGADPDVPAGLGSSLPDLGRCQLDAVKLGHKLEEKLLKTANGTKKRYLKGHGQIPPVVSAAELESRINSMMLGDPKLQKQGEKLDGKITKRCGGVDAGSLQSGFPGCNPATASALSACVRAAARCRGCVKINLMDGLAIDCDTVDDFQVNSSCTASPPVGTPTPSSGVTPTFGPTPTGGPKPTSGPTPTPSPTPTPTPTVGPTPTPSPT